MSSAIQRWIVNRDEHAVLDLACLTIEELPVNLQNLNCTGCTNLKKLPELPPNLQKLNCSFCKNLEELSKIPESLQTLCCNNCSTKELPKLPQRLLYLYCNNIESLPPILPIGDYL